MSKLIVVNGRLVDESKNPTVLDPRRAIAVPYTFQAANEAAEVTGGQLATSTIHVINTVQSDAYADKLGATVNAEGEKVVDGKELITTVSNVFAAAQAPIGLGSKLIGLEGTTINIKIDDSTSMTWASANGLSRWQNVYTRLIQLIEMLKLVPTGRVHISFLDRNDSITLTREGKTPEQFVAMAKAEIDAEFARPPRGGTPIFNSVQAMLGNAVGRTAHYLFTDGEPTGFGTEPEDIEREIDAVKNLLLQRYDPQNNPFTFLCCSDKPEDTLWMHEIEEIACCPGKGAGYVAAVQNFRAEQLEVLNDQGPEFPYSEAIWKICSLTAAMNPNDLDALDQYAPLSKPTLDRLIGRELTLTEYESYFNHHPNGNWLFGEDYNSFLTADVANLIPSVARFDTLLAMQLNTDLDMGNDFSEPTATAWAEKIVQHEFHRPRPPTLVQAREDFWKIHYIQMEKSQLRHTQNFASLARQDLWGDYVAARGIWQYWVVFVGEFQQRTRQVIHLVHQPIVAQQEGQEGIPDEQQPPSYEIAVQHQYFTPQYTHNIQPYHRQSYNLQQQGQGLAFQQQQLQQQQQPYPQPSQGGGYDPRFYGQPPQQPLQPVVQQQPRSGCCTIS